MNQIVQIDMAATATTAYEHFPEIRAAIENAALGLYSKYDVRINDIQTVREQVIMHVEIPDNIASTFKIGYHLRGVSAYLLKHYRETFAQLVVAKRLLVYTVIPTQTYNDESRLTFNDRLTAISDFSNLLKRSDEASMNKIIRIIDILKED